MAGHFELHSFLNKFCNFWSSGRNARLAVECQAGQATVNLQLDLGLPHSHPQEPPQQKRVGPSCLRRLARREQARSEAAVDAAVNATAAEEEADKQTNTNKAAVKATPSQIDKGIMSDIMRRRFRERGKSSWRSLDLQEQG